jgi:hypothetical protein
MIASASIFRSFGTETCDLLRVKQELVESYLHVEETPWKLYLHNHLQGVFRVAGNHPHHIESVGRAAGI